MYCSLIFPRAKQCKTIRDDLTTFIKKPKVILELSKIPKAIHPSTYQDNFHNIPEHHNNHFYIFTDGSKNNNKTACVAILNKKFTRKALPKESFLFLAEAMVLTLHIISESNHKKLYYIRRLALFLNITKK